MSSALGELQTPKANCPDTGETVKMQWQPELSAKSIESVVWGMNCSVDWKESGVELILTLSLSLSLPPPVPPSLSYTHSPFCPIFLPTQLCSTLLRASCSYVWMPQCLCSSLFQYNSPPELTLFRATLEPGDMHSISTVRWTFVGTLRPWR